MFRFFTQTLVVGESGIRALKGIHYQKPLMPDDLIIRIPIHHVRFSRLPAAMFGFFSGISVTIYIMNQHNQLKRQHQIGEDKEYDTYPFELQAHPDPQGLLSTLNETLEWVFTPFLSQAQKSLIKARRLESLMVSSADSSRLLLKRINPQEKPIPRVFAQINPEFFPMSYDLVSAWGQCQARGEDFVSTLNEMIRRMNHHILPNNTDSCEVSKIYVIDDAATRAGIVRDVLQRALSNLGNILYIKIDGLDDHRCLYIGVTAQYHEGMLLIKYLDHKGEFTFKTQEKAKNHLNQLLTGYVVECKLNRAVFYMNGFLKNPTSSTQSAIGNDKLPRPN